MRRPRGVFEVLAGVIGEAADWLHLRTGAWLPWAVRMAIAILWDAVDIRIRIYSWPFFIIAPGVSHFVRGILNIILVVFGAVLWGAAGLLQALEIVFDVIPGIGWLLDLAPILTIAGFVSRRREREAGGNERAAVHTAVTFREGASMTFVFGVGGCILAASLWLLGAVGFGWAIVIAAAGFAVGFLLPFVLETEIPPGVLGWSAAIVGALLAIALGTLGYFYYSSPESYRRAAWQELAGQDDWRVKAAARADKLGETVNLEGITGAAGEAIGAVKEKAAQGLTKFKSDVPALSDLAGWLSKKLEAKPEPAKETEKRKKNNRFEMETKELELGPVQSMLYRSGFVLERAKSMREGRIATAGNWAMILTGLLTLVGILASVQGRGRDRAAQVMTPGVNLDDMI